MKIAVTKLKEKSEGIPELFRRYGHEALIISTITAAEPTDPAPLLRLADMVSKGEIDILIFTSSLGVDRFFEKGRPAENIRIVCVGPKTSEKVEEYGFKSEVIHSFSSEYFADYLGDIRGKTIGLARAEVKNPELIGSLEEKGAVLFEAAAYRLEPTENTFMEMIKGVDAVIFTSTRSFESFCFDKNQVENIIIIAIGEKTATSMKKRGVVPDIVGNGTLESCLSLLKRVANA